MRIAISSSGRDLDARPDAAFGRCEYFLFIDTDADAVSAEPNPGFDAGGGAGVKAARFVVDHGTEAVLTGRVGPHAFDVLSRANVPIYDVGAADARTALDRYRAGSLPEVETAGPPRGRRG